MKLFQRLLVAPALLGLVAPLGANAAEHDFNGVSDYSSSRSSRSSKNRIKGFSQFSDVYPSDWAYKTLSTMLENHGCAPISGGGVITRYEAAALLNSCLENVSEANEEERRLINEFSQEIALIKGRSDVLEAGISMSEAGSFSATTKMSGSAVFVIGGSTQESGTKEATTFNYHTAYDLETSFGGEDLLITSIESGNFTDSDPFGCSGDLALETCYNSSSLEVSKLYYQTPWNDDFTLTVGPKVRQDDMLGVWPSAYPADTVLDVLTYAGANAAYSLAEGAGAGVTYAKGNISASLVFVSENADTATNSSGGLLTTSGSDDVTAQLAWVDDGFTIAAAYTVADGGNDTDAITSDDYKAIGLSGYYELDTGIAYLPSSISAGFGWKDPSTTNKAGHVVHEQTWTLGLQWDDFFIDGNTLGIAYGTAQGHKHDIGTDPTAAELFYSMPITDSITVTPALFHVEKEWAGDYQGALVKTTFSF